VAAIADVYLAGVSTRGVDKLVRTLGIEGMSKSEVSRLAASLDEIVAATAAAPGGRLPAAIPRRLGRQGVRGGMSESGRRLARRGRLRRWPPREHGAGDDHRRGRRRTDVVGIFPSRDAALRLVGALLAEQNDEWADSDRRYISLEAIAKTLAVSDAQPILEVPMIAA
jgi:Transposase, Mutator family